MDMTATTTTTTINTSLAALPTELLLALFPLLDTCSLALLARSCRRLWHTAIPVLYHTPDISSLRSLHRLAHSLALDAGLDQAIPATYVNLPDYPTKRRGRAHTPTDHRDHDTSQFDQPSTDPRLLSLLESASNPTLPTSPCRLIRHLRIISLAAMAGKWDQGAARIYAPALEMLARAVRRAYWVLTLTNPASPAAPSAAPAPAFSPTSPTYAHSPCGFAALHLAHTWDLPDLAHLPDSTVQIVALNVGPQLKSLDLELCVSLGPNAIFSLAAHCPNLQELRVADGPRLSDACLHGLTLGCKHLLLLDCAGAEDVTDAGLRALVLGCPKLVEVNAKGCFGILMSNDDVQRMAAETRRSGLVVHVGKRQFSHTESDSDGDSDNDVAAAGLPHFDVDDDMVVSELDFFDQLDIDHDFAGGWDAAALLQQQDHAAALLDESPLPNADSQHQQPVAEEEADEEAHEDEDLDQDDGFQDHMTSEDELDLFACNVVDLAAETAAQRAIAEADAAWHAHLANSTGHVSIVPASSILNGSANAAGGGSHVEHGVSSDDEHMWTDVE